MNTSIRNSIAIAFLIGLTTGCTDTTPTSKTTSMSKSKPTKPVTHTKPSLPPGEKGNRTTNSFRDSTIKMDTELNFLRLQGEWVFATPFNKHDGLGDGPINPNNKVEPGGRLTLPAFPAADGKPGEGNEFFLRVNGLDSQTCVECHFIVNNSTVPATFGVGGVGGAGAMAFPAATVFTPASQAPKSPNAANYNGRAINPPFLFGSGGVELLAKEMTQSLQEQLKAASQPPVPDRVIELNTHGVDFGSVVWEKVGAGNSHKQLSETKTNCDLLDKKTSKMAKLKRFIAITPAARIYSWEDSNDYGTLASMKHDNLMSKHHDVMPGLELNTSQLAGIDGDLVVKPFGRKGNNVTTRDFDCGAIRFHMGMEPVEIVGKDNDHDGDGIKNEVTIAEMSALAIFSTTSPKPVQDEITGNGAGVFEEIGCNNCHIPIMKTKGHILPYQQPEQPQQPFSDHNKYYEVDLVNSPADFEADPDNSEGMLVKLFSDLKRHDMGPRLQESLAGASGEQNRSFVTARLWGVADTAPYLHDGRATTLTEAIEFHGGDAQEESDKFSALSDRKKTALLDYLRTLHAPAPEALEIE